MRKILNKLALDIVTNGDCIRDLVNKGRARGYIGLSELLKCLPPKLDDQEQIEDIIKIMEEMGISVKREA